MNLSYLGPQFLEEIKSRPYCAFSRSSTNSARAAFNSHSCLIPRFLFCFPQSFLLTRFLFPRNFSPPPFARLFGFWLSAVILFFQILHCKADSPLIRFFTPSLNFHLPNIGDRFVEINSLFAGDFLGIYLFFPTRNTLFYSPRL